LTETFARGKASGVSGSSPPAESIRSKKEDPSGGRVSSLMESPAIANLPPDIRDELEKHLLNIYLIPYGSTGGSLPNLPVFEESTWTSAEGASYSKAKSTSDRTFEKNSMSTALEAAGRASAGEEIKKQLAGMVSEAVRSSGIQTPVVADDVAKSFAEKARNILLEDFPYKGKEGNEKHANQLMEALFRGYIPKNGKLVFYRAKVTSRPDAYVPREPKHYRDPNQTSSQNQGEADSRAISSPQKYGQAPPEVRTALSDTGMWGSDQSEFPVQKRKSTKPRHRADPIPAKPKDKDAASVTDKLPQTPVPATPRTIEEVSDPIALLPSIPSPIRSFPMIIIQTDPVSKAAPAPQTPSAAVTPTKQLTEKIASMVLKFADLGVGPKNTSILLNVDLDKVVRLMRSNGYAFHKGGLDRLEKARLNTIKRLFADGRSLDEILAEVGAKSRVSMREPQLPLSPVASKSLVVVGKPQLALVSFASLVRDAESDALQAISALSSAIKFTSGSSGEAAHTSSNQIAYTIHQAPTEQPAVSLRRHSPEADLTEERKGVASKLSELGVGPTMISRMMGVDVAEVRILVKSEGHTPHYGRLSHMEEKRMQRIRELFAEGKSIDEIAAEVGPGPGAGRPTPKSHPLNDVQKSKILDLIRENPQISSTEISEKTDIGIYQIKCFRKEQDCSAASGRQTSFTEDQKSLILDFIRENPFITSFEISENTRIDPANITYFRKNNNCARPRGRSFSLTKEQVSKINYMYGKGEFVEGKVSSRQGKLIGAKPSKIELFLEIKGRLGQQSAVIGSETVAVSEETVSDEAKGHGRWKSPTKEVLKEIRRLAELKTPPRIIGEKVGLSKGRARDLMNSMGYFLPRGKPPALKDDQYKRIRELAAKEMNAHRIAAELKLSENTVRRFLDKEKRKKELASPSEAGMQEIPSIMRKNDDSSASA
jgi:hypothetical protein